MGYMIKTASYVCRSLVLLLFILKVTAEVGKETMTSSDVLNSSNFSVGSTFDNGSGSNKSEVPSGLPFHTIAITMIMYSLIFLIGFFGNALVIFVVCWNKSLQHNTNYCLVNLSIADLLLIVVCMPSAIVDLYAKEVWYFGYLLCKIIPWLEHTIAHASILTVVAISVERSLAIVFPLKAIRVFTSKRLFLVVILIWIISMLFSLPIMTATVYSIGYHKQLGMRVNVCYSQFKEPWQLTYLFISLIIFYMLPCILLFVLYGKIVYVIKNRNVKNLTASRQSSTEYRSSTKVDRYSVARDANSLIETDAILKLDANNQDIENTMKIKNNNQKSANKPPQINQKQIIILLIIMMFLILLLLLPYRVFSIWAALATKQKLIKLGINNFYSILNFCRVTFYINSAINPIFYHILSSKFQNAFKNVLKYKKSNGKSLASKSLNNRASQMAD